MNSLLFLRLYVLSFDVVTHARRNAVIAQKLDKFCSVDLY